MPALMHTGRRFSSVLILAALTSACLGCGATWQPIRKDRIAEVVNRSQPDRARVLAGGSTMEVRYPAVRADTLRGTVKTGGRRRPIFVSLDSVDSLYLYRNRASTTVVGVGMAASLLFLAAVLVHQPPSVKY